jgi:hypothetical protein
MNGMASRTILTKTMAKEFWGLDSEPEGSNRTAAARKSAGR